MRDETAAPYNATSSIVEQAKAIIARQMERLTDVLTAPDVVRDYLILNYGAAEREEFLVLFLDTQNRLIAVESVFQGTLDAASVYPREVAKAALRHNAAGVIFAHNHPSGVPDPSEADKRITNRLVDALKLLDIRVLDHLIVAGTASVSFSERGLL
jgi:DNA repair protein RadC